MLFLRYYLWVVPHLLCGVGAIFAFRKKIHKTYPAFISLLIFDFVFELWVLWAVALLWPSQQVYKWCVVFDVLAAFGLELLVLYEIVSNLAISRVSLGRLLRPLPRWTAAILILLAVAATASLPQTTREQVIVAFQSSNLGLNIIAIGLLLTMLLSARILGIRFRNLALGIALGIGITAAAEIATSPLISLGRRSYITLDLIRMAAFHISTVVWLVYIFFPEGSPPPKKSRLEYSDLEVHVRELQRIVQR